MEREVGGTLKAYVASHLKDLNRQTVYSVISSKRETSKAEIARETGISSPTVIKIVNHFIEKGLVSELGRDVGDAKSPEDGALEARRPMGRRPNLLTFNQNAAYSIGIEFEGSFLKIGLVNLAHEIVSFEKIHITESFQTVLSRRIPVIARSLMKKSALRGAPVLGLAVGIPSIFDTDSLMIEATPLIGLSDRLAVGGLLDGLRDALGLPVFLENDVKAAALGEFWAKGKEITDLIYISLGTGLAAGIILDGRLRKGRHNIAGEIGYLVSHNDTANSIKRTGSLERAVNIVEVERLLGGSLEDFDRRSEALSPIRERIAAELSVYIANLCTSLDVGHVVLGGILSDYLGPEFTALVSERVNRLAILEVEIAGNSRPEPGICGAALIVFNNTLDSLLA